MNNDAKLDFSQNWVNDFSKTIAQHTIRLLVAKAQNGPDNIVDLLFQSTLEYMIRYAVVFNIDKNHFQHLPKNQIDSAIYSRFHKFRGQIEETIGDAFTGAITNFDANQFEYYCQIKPSLPPIGGVQ